MKKPSQKPPWSPRAKCAGKEVRAALRERLMGAERVAVLGVGSELRGDDAVGILVARTLAGAAQRSAEDLAGPDSSPRLRVLIGGTVPENLTAEIKRFRPTHLVIIDAADLGEPPGAFRLVDAAKAGGVSFSTHTLPIGLLVAYLREHFPCEVIIVGVQPKTLEFGAPPSREAKNAVKRISAAIRQTLKLAARTDSPPPTTAKRCPS